MESPLCLYFKLLMVRKLFGGVHHLSECRELARVGTVVGTVKKHGEFKGKNTTTITRAKLD